MNASYIYIRVGPSSWVGKRDHIPSFYKTILAKDPEERRKAEQEHNSIVAKLEAQAAESERYWNEMVEGRDLLRTKKSDEKKDRQLEYFKSILAFIAFLIVLYLIFITLKG